MNRGYWLVRADITHTDKFDEYAKRKGVPRVNLGSSPEAARKIAIDSYTKDFLSRNKIGVVDKKTKKLVIDPAMATPAQIQQLERELQQFFGVK